MNGEIIVNNWALVAGVALALFVAILVSAAIFRKSAYGKLRQVRIDLNTALQERRKVVSRSKNAEERLHKLAEKSDTTKPRVLQEAKEFLEDAKALEKIADDKVLIAKNHVRRVIHEEYPPKAHERMRKKYLPSEKIDKRPFSF